MKSLLFLNLLFLCTLVATAAPRRHLQGEDGWLRVLHRDTRELQGYHHGYKGILFPLRGNSDGGGSRKVARENFPPRPRPPVPPFIVTLF
ncbi:hypothetical protein B566_EDAN009179 [Ephemera danica]|nr:hypothetical protein B566_EDAN009179 [Ephemera danica]